MVLTAGLSCEESLRDFLESTKSVTNKVRLISVVINDAYDRLVLSQQANSNAQTDDVEFDQNIGQVFAPEKPQYILYETDEKNWLQILYLPEGSSSSKDKMVYASSQASLKQDFGERRISEQFTVNRPEEMRWSKIKTDHLEKGNKEDLLSPYERSLNQAKADEEAARSAYKKDGTHGVQSGALNFNLDAGATSAVADFAQGNVNFVTLKLNVKKEVFECVLSEKVEDYSEVEGKVSNEAATYNLLKFVHESGSYNIFFMCMPSNAGLAVKERMLNASCRNGLINTITGSGIELHQSPQIDGSSEVSLSELNRLVAPVEASGTGFVKKTVGRPGRPGNRPRPRPATRNEAVDL